MKIHVWLAACCAVATWSGAAAQLNPATLPVYQAPPRPAGDWLLGAGGHPAAVYRMPGGQLALSNGLITRRFSLEPAAATIGFDNLITGASLLRAASPEAVLLVEGRRIPVGGLTGQPIGNYLSPDWLPDMKADSDALSLFRIDTMSLKERFPWKPHPEWMPAPAAWPPKGLELVFSYRASAALLARRSRGAGDPLQGVLVQVHYALYDGMPLLSKWVTIASQGNHPLQLDNLSVEELALTEAESAVEHRGRWRLPPLFVQSDFAFHAMAPADASENACVQWLPDSTYTTQVNYLLQTPCLLVCRPRAGIGETITREHPFESMRIWELAYDSDDRERRGLAERKMYRLLAPWSMENPIMMHVTGSSDEAVRKAIDQCAAVGFEMVIMSFGSGFNLEDSSAANLDRMRRLADYARSRHIALGGYSLLASRSIGPADDVVMPDSLTQPAFGHSPCLLSAWGEAYFRNLYRFYEQTGLEMLEHDGSYPGDVCASTAHPGHKGLQDAQWKQFAAIRDFYRWCRGRGIFLNVPDWYFLQGSNKNGMGYRETNWSLPRAYQEVIERQNIYDGTFEKTPSMGWMFVPLVEYHGGGAAATIEPLKAHLPHYGRRLANLFGAGVQACYRGPQLFDAPATEALVEQWVSFYKKHRRILDADIIHLRRPDGRDYDGLLHADPQGPEKGLLMVYNPLDHPITRTLDLDLYYTGLRQQARYSIHDGPFRSATLRGSRLRLTLTLPARGCEWVVFRP